MRRRGRRGEIVFFPAALRRERNSDFCKKRETNFCFYLFLQKRSPSPLLFEIHLLNSKFGCTPSRKNERKKCEAEKERETERKAEISVEVAVTLAPHSFGFFRASLFLLLARKASTSGGERFSCADVESIWRVRIVST